MPDLGFEESVNIEFNYKSEYYRLFFDTNSNADISWRGYYYDSRIDLPVLTSNDKPGYEFGGWYLDEQCTKLFDYTIMSDMTPDLEGDADITLYAKWYELCAIVFDSDGGTACASITQRVGTYVTLPVSYKTGHDGSWGDYAFGSKFYIPETIVGEDKIIRFKAIWKPKTYTIYFNFSGGWARKTSEEVEYKSGFPKIETPEKSGYKFEYYMDNNGNPYYVGSGSHSAQYLFADDLYLIAVWSEAYLKLEIVGKSGGTWKIRITNTSSTNLYIIEYNTKMCFHDDAKNWTKLYDICSDDSHTIIPGGSITVSINENWFATDIAVSYVTSNNVRMITYADNLNTNGTLKLYYNKIII